MNKNNLSQTEEIIIKNLNNWIKKERPELKQIEEKILGEIKKADYLKEDWQVEYARQRILEKIDKDFNKKIKEKLIPASQGKRFLHCIVFFIMYYVGMYLFIQLINVFILDIILFFGFYLLFEGVWQKTPGKFLTKTKVVMLDGSKPDLLHILGRTASRYIPFDALSFLVNKNPIGWHDSISKTLVVPENYFKEYVKNN